MSFDKINKDNAERIYEKHSVLKTNGFCFLLKSINFNSFYKTEIAKPLKESRAMKRLKNLEKEKTLG